MPPTVPARRRNPADTLLTALALAASLIWLVGWIPHYIHWPWWIDLDTYATIARGWSLGIQPYRDVETFNFPGQIYAFWLLGQTSGWGRTPVLYVLDVTLLLAFGILLIAWSRRTFRLWTPGAFAFTATLCYYLRLDFADVAQRDWHGPLLAIAGLLTLQTWRSTTGLLLSAALFALGFVVRPHVVLFLPAYAASMLLGETYRPSLRPLLRTAAIWTLSTALITLLLFLPLILNGLIDDLFHALRAIGYGSRYAKLARIGLLESLARQLGILAPDSPFIDLPPPLAWVDRARVGFVLALQIGAFILAVRSPRLRTSTRPRITTIWLVAFLSVLFYEPLHPMRHPYLAHPLRLVWAIHLGLLAAWLLPCGDPPFPARPRHLALVALLILTLAPYWPRFVDYPRSLIELQTPATLAPPIRVPPGASDRFAHGKFHSPYAWDDYRSLLVYLRRATQPTTRVANLLRNVPFPAVNGPIGRPSPLPTEAGIPYLYSVAPEREPDFARAIIDAPADSVVVWDPEQPSFTPVLELPTLAQAIRDHYRREARFGVIEVWRRAAH